VTRPDPANAKIINQYVKCNGNTTYMKTTLSQKNGPRHYRL